MREQERSRRRRQGRRWLERVVGIKKEGARCTMDIFSLLSLPLFYLYSLRPPSSLLLLYEASYSLPLARTSCGSQFSWPHRPHHVLTALATDHAPGYGATARDYQNLG